MLDHCIIVRQWALDRRLSINELFDSPDLIDQIAKNAFRRVILRFRFDRGMGKEFAYHIQIGGYGRAPDEYCGYPRNIDVPRFPFFPMNLFLVSEFLLANYYPHEWHRLRNDGAWQDLICKAQQCVLSYIESLELNFGCTIMAGRSCAIQKSVFSRMSGAD